jgi:hypothetical protein
MIFQPGEIDALGYVSARHPGEPLVTTIALENSTPWLAVSVTPRVTRVHYVISADGDVWESANGVERTHLIRAAPRR